MMPLEYDYNIRFEFPRRPESAAAVAERFVKTLEFVEPHRCAFH